MEEAERGARKEVLVSTFAGINVNFMPWAAAPAGDDKEFALLLKAFIGMIMTAEEKARLARLHKGIGKESLHLLVWIDYPAIGKGRLMTADNYIIYSLIFFERFKLPPIPPDLFLDLLRRQGGEVGIEHDQTYIFPPEGIPSPLFKMGKTTEVVLQGLFAVAVKLMIAENRKIRDLFLAKSFIEIIEFLPYSPGAAANSKIAEVDHECRLAARDFIKDYLSLLMIPLSPELEHARALCIADNDEAIFVGINIGKPGIPRYRLRSVVRYAVNHGPAAKKADNKEEKEGCCESPRHLSTLNLYFLHLRGVLAFKYLRRLWANKSIKDPVFNIAIQATGNG